MSNQLPVLKLATERLVPVAPYLQESFVRLRELDEESVALKAEIEKRCEEELAELQKRAQSGAEASPSSALGPEWDRLFDVNQRKHDLAYQIYDFLDKSIQKVDSDINHLGNEIDLERETFGLPPAPEPKANPNEGAYAALADPAAQAAAEVAGGHVEPNEPLYCYCQQVSYGEMVGCENPDCRVEWFHYGCVGLKPGEKIKGKWYCPECRPIMQQKQRERASGRTGGR